MQVKQIFHLESPKGFYIDAQKVDGKGAIVFSKSADGKNFGEVKIIGESKNFEMI